MGARGQAGFQIDDSEVTKSCSSETDYTGKAEEPKLRAIGSPFAIYENF
jgi:hypothetical protein